MTLSFLCHRGKKEGLNWGRQGENLFPFRFTQESTYKLKCECYYMPGLVASNEMTWKHPIRVRRSRKRERKFIFANESRFSVVFVMMLEIFLATFFLWVVAQLRDWHWMNRPRSGKGRIHQFFTTHLTALFLCIFSFHQSHGFTQLEGFFTSVCLL